MTRDLPEPGTVIHYPYLWASQRDRGETEDRKPHPVCVALRIHDPGQKIHHLVLLAISSQQPNPDQRALEIPDTERRRGGFEPLSACLDRGQ